MVAKAKISARRPAIMEAGVQSSQIESFVAELRAAGYSPHTVRGYSDSARHFCAWLRQVGVTPCDVDEKIVGREIAEAVRARVRTTTTR